MDIVKLSWSGGKDSTASVLLHNQRGDELKIVTFIPMLTDEIPLIRKSHFEFINNTAERFRNFGHTVHILTGRTYLDHFYRAKTRGKYKGTIAGYDLGVGYCKFRDYSKIQTLKDFNVGYYDYESIGIAVDETARHGQLNDKLRSILVEQNITEKQAYDICVRTGMLSPQYELSGRDGCCICPNAKDIEYIEYLKEYPDAIEILRTMDYVYSEHLKKGEIKPDSPFRNHMNFTDRMIKLGVI